MSLKDEILEAVRAKPGMTDRDLTNKLRGGTTALQQPINQAAHSLESQGLLIRKERHDLKIGNYIGDADAVKNGHQEAKASMKKNNHDKVALSEDEIKTVLDEKLKSSGWSTSVAWGRRRGIDIDAKQRSDRLIIEVKGPGSRNAMRVNYFLAILGETLQRMNDTNARYMIALPDLAQYRGLWERLPSLAKEKTGISLLLVSPKGDIEWLNQKGADPFK